MRNRILAMAVMACFMTLMAVHNAMAARPNAGQTIDNTVTVDYKDALGYDMDQVSDTVSVLVLQVYSVDVTPAFDSMSSCTGTETLYAFTVTNTGNGSDTFVISSVHQASDWEDATVTFYTDAGISPLAGNVVLGNSSSIDLWAGIDTPVWSSGISGQQSIDRLTATSLGSGSTVSDYDEVTTTVVAADLTVVKDTVPSGKITPQQYVVANTVTYEITVTNNGNADATAVSVSDTFNALFVNLSTTTGSLTGNTLSYNHGALAVGGSFTITVTGEVKAGTADGTYGNTASVSFTTCGNVEQVTDSVNIQVVSADLSGSTKFANATSFEVGDTVVYTIRLYNVSLSYDATNIDVNDTLPSVFTNLSSSVGSFTGNDFFYNHSSLAANTFFDIIITGTVDGGGTIKSRTQVVNTASITYYSGSELKGPVTPSETIYIQAPVLTVDKTADTATAAPGDTITYTITVTNTGGADARSVVITDTLSGFVTFGAFLGGADAPVNCAPTESSGVITGHASFGGYPADVIPAGGTMTFKYTVTVDTTP